MTPSRQRIVSCTLWALALCGAAPGAAQNLAFVEVSSELDDGGPATFAYNLVDGREKTAWCSKVNPSGEEIVLGFMEPTSVTGLSIYAGMRKGEALDPTKQRVRMLRLSDGVTQREIKLKDSPELQSVQFDPPAEGRRFLLRIESTWGEGIEAAPVCIGEVVVRSGKRVLTGEGVAPKIRSLNTPGRRLLHLWLDDPSAPERSLRFGLDGTFRYRFEPLLDGDPVSLQGNWFASHGRLTLEVNGKRFHLKSRHSRSDDGERLVEELTLTGSAPDPSMVGTYRAAPRRAE